MMWAGSADTLCGIALGAPSADLALPAWWSDRDSDGKVRYGWLDVNTGGISQMLGSVRETLGRVSQIDVSLEIEDAASEKAVFAALRALVVERLGATGHKTGRTIAWPVAGTLAGALELRVASFNMDGDRIHRVEVILTLATDVVIEAEPGSLFVDIDALAEILESAAFPRDRCREVFARYFARDSMWSVDREDKEQYRAILAAAHAGRPGELRTLIERVCRLVDLSDLEHGDSVRGCYLLAGLLHDSPNLAIARSTPTGLLATNVRDVLRFLEMLEVPPGERAAWAFTVIAALEWADAAAAQAIRDRLARTSVATTEAHLVWDTTDEIEARAFALLTSPLPSDEARLLAAARTRRFSSSTVRACVAYFERQGIPRPAVKLARQDDPGVRAWSELLTLARARFPGSYDDVVASFLELNMHSGAMLRAVCDAVADGTAPGTRSTWQLGTHTVAHSGKPQAGRWTFKRGQPKAAPTTAAPAAPEAAPKTARKAAPRTARARKSASRTLRA
ncbi:MAG: hypothetical protein M3680_25440 [Myxococcota bacterium]|nr:hypothetical protein [Myxococcota bacterium]